ncbi:MAG: hypothetical protein ACYSW3_02190 [Planctomycetota bacterium]|jgi:hypothetical protein
MTKKRKGKGINMPKGKMDYSDLDRLNIFIDGLSGKDPSEGIVESEKRGQQHFVNTDVLPKVIRPPKAKQTLEEMGVIFGEDDDDLFVDVTLPEGWKKEPTDHDMWSRLLDADGNEVAMIFYKAAFYDRDAFLSFTPKED